MITIKIWKYTKPNVMKMTSPKLGPEAVNTNALFNHKIDPIRKGYT